MIDELDESLRQLLIKEAELDPAVVDISFDIPTREWSAPVQRPTVNLYLYDIRENLERREMYWDQDGGANGRVNLRRRPVRIDLSYMVTCWTTTTEDQHRLLWRVLETLFRQSPLPRDILQGAIADLKHPVRTQVAQPDGVLKNVSDFWGALENQLRPSISLVVTLDLDLNEVVSAPLVFAKALRVGHRLLPDSLGEEEEIPLELEPGSDETHMVVAGIVRTTDGDPVEGASVRLLGTRQVGGHPVQVGPTILSDASGRYRFSHVRPGEYTLVIETGERAPQQHALTLALPEEETTPPEFIREVEVRMKKG